MKVGVVSDVHNNVEALTCALETLRDCELILNLGDLVSQYRVTPEIVRLSREAGLVGILGNHEKSILAPCGFPMRSQLGEAELEFLRDLPDQLDLEVDGRRVKVAHGAPWDDPASIDCCYVFEQDYRMMARLAATPADVLLLGHTHVAMAVQSPNLLVLNPGSCGEGRDRQRRLSFAELDFARGSATVYELLRGAAPEPLLRRDF